MATKLRGLQLFRQLCRSYNTSSSIAAQPPLGSIQVSAEHTPRAARAFAAQAAQDLASDGPLLPVEEQSHRELEHQAHQNLLQSLQVALSEAHATEDTLTSPQSKTSKRRANKYLREFAPLKLVLSAVDTEHSEEELRMLEKWQRQLHQECSTIDELRDKYVEAEAQPGQIQHGLDLERKHGDLEKSKNYIRRDKYNKAKATLRRIGKGAHTPAANQLMVQWFPALRDAIEEEQQACMNGVSGKDRLSYGPYLYALSPDVLAVLTMHGVLGTLLSDDEAGRAKLTRLAISVGKMVNEQIGIENMKRRVDLEHRRQRVYSKLTRAMWAEHDECTQMGYDWAPRRAKWEARLKELHSLRGDKSVPRLNPNETLKPLGWGTHHWKGSVTDQKLPNDVLYSQACAHLATLEETAGPSSSSSPESSEAAAAVSEQPDWFQVDPRYESRIAEIKNRWYKLSKNTGSLREQDKRAALGTEVWGSNMLAKVGVALFVQLAKSATIQTDLDWRGESTGAFQEVTAFQHGIENFYDPNGKGWWKKYGMVNMHPAVLRRLSDHEKASSILPRWMPMLIPPKPWSAPNVGGYLSNQSLIMRVRGSTMQINQLFSQHKQGKLSQVYEALNSMGETAWGINPKVLEQVQHAYQDLKGGFCGLPLHESVEDAPLPTQPPQRFRTDVYKGQLTARVMDPSRREMFLFKSDLNKAKKKRRELHSLRCDLAYKLHVANDYMNEDGFYFPHNLDFRGRAYPMHPNLNHLGADLSRGLLQFADAKPLGPDGLRWLEISVANLYGKGADKLSFDGRVEFARNHMNEIFDAAENPSGGSRWWQAADSPWQLLAVCYDLKAALASGDPEGYMSKLPIHQDGSCNGLQHYAALGRDESGGRAVNLLPVDKPQDVYTEIAQLVQKQVDVDEARGIPEATVLRDNVDRKLVKQTVMTSVYGVTFVGARHQIGNRLKERGWEDDRLVYKASCYGARVTLKCLHQMFDSAKDIMQWLSLCARVVAKADKPVHWTTPLGLPVVQPYRKKSKTHVQTLLQRVILVHQTDESPIQRVRQRSAFPPNFIHSIDSSHMMLTAIACQRAGLAFAGVHDSFWTHAGSVDTMNRILREKFYELHSQPLLSNLRDELLAESPDLDIPEVPVLGSLQLEKINDAKYFFN